VSHPFVEDATRFCWERIDALTETDPYQARAILDAQASHGSWPFNWPAWTPLVHHEWGGKHGIVSRSGSSPWNAAAKIP
jgi:hypothetical protein